MIWSFYKGDSGIFISKKFLATRSDAVAANTPVGTVAIAGDFDELSQRFDLATGKVVDYQPPQPDDDHEWNEQTKRWTLKPEVQERIHRQAQARAQIEALEKKMARPLSELLSPTTDDATKAIAQQKLAELTAERDRIAIESGLRKTSDAQQ